MQDFAQQAGDKATRCHDTSSLPLRWGHQPVFPRGPNCRAFKRPPETEDQILEGHTGVTRPHPGPPPSSGRVKAKAAVRRPWAPRRGSSGHRAKPQGTGHAGSGGVLPCRRGAWSSARGVATRTQGSQWETLNEARRPIRPCVTSPALATPNGPGSTHSLRRPQRTPKPEDPSSPFVTPGSTFFFFTLKPDCDSH